MQILSIVCELEMPTSPRLGSVARSFSYLRRKRKSSGVKEGRVPLITVTTGVQKGCRSHCELAMLSWIKLGVQLGRRATASSSYLTLAPPRAWGPHAWAEGAVGISEQL